MPICASLSPPPPTLQPLPKAPGPSQLSPVNHAKSACLPPLTCDPAVPRAILDLKNQRDRLHQYQRRITVLTDRETAIAKQMLAQGDKKRALLALRRKKYQESLLAKTDGQLEQLEKLTSSVEFALIQKDVVFGLQQGTKVLRDIHAEMGGIAHVEKLMGDTADAVAYQQVCSCFSYRDLPRAGKGSLVVALAPPITASLLLTILVPEQEVSEMLSGRISNQDEDEVEDELAALEAELSGARPVSLPSAPNTVPERTGGEEVEPEPAKTRQTERQAVLA